MLKEHDATLHNIKVSIGNIKILSIPELLSQDILDIFPVITATVCHVGNCQRAFISKIPEMIFAKTITATTDGDAAYDLDFGTLGE